MSTCKRDIVARDRDETETFEKYVSRPSRDRDVETETTTLIHIQGFSWVLPRDARSAKRGIAIVSHIRLSVCLSVRNVNVPWGYKLD